MCFLGIGNSMYKGFVVRENLNIKGFWRKVRGVGVERVGGNRMMK